ncbi:hypothetical protein Poli38472_000841 [Pythium oligandrum]|uniref:FYVE-type domain-containing protein n=1 Tax=Pythium oligandrum TaxID=41045 RepID=A0A8K1CD11_PYTOL|nr:hypothetical protein Poli38472_000841 [Pythium oligandrum]|eukprot:TMW60799.1 hypothetical protein Poli38472_000841 [Pythium oligandrum]
MAATSGSSGYSMFPIVEKTYRVRITEDIERDLRFLGQSRIDALTSEFDMPLVKEKGNLKIYELSEKEFFTMKGTTTVSAPIGDVMSLLKMESTSKMRDVMGEIFGTLFLEGMVLYRAKETPNRLNEALSVNWMALQSSKPHLPHRDYVFLRYADVFEKQGDNGSVYGSNGSGLFIGASIWESIELDGTTPLPASNNVVRMRLRRCGIVVEETNHEDLLKISLYLSEAHPGRAAVSSLTKQWMTKMVGCVVEVGNIMVARALASQQILTKQQFVKDGICCHICIKAFTLLRRKHHCRVCGDVVCSKCSEMKSLKQGGLNKEVRICHSCRNNSSLSVRSSGSTSDSRAGKSVTGGNGSINGSLSKQSFSTYSMSSTDSEDTLQASVSSTAVAAYPIIHENSIHSAYSDSASSIEPPRMKTHPTGRTHLESNEMSGPSLTRHGSRGPTDMIILNSMNKGAIDAQNDMIMLNKGRMPNSASTDSYPDYTKYARPGPGLSEAEMAAMELALTVRQNSPFSYALSYSSRHEWPKAPIPANEAVRLKKVRELLLTDPGQQFQEMCEYAAAELGCQIASICFVGDKSGFLMSRVGVVKQELPRNVIFEAHTIMSEEPMIILDAGEDIRFVKNPMVTENMVRFYAGFPLVTSDGSVVGSFSVADPFARECLNGDKFFFLKNLAEVIIRGVEENTRNAGQQLRTQGPVSVAMPPPPADMNYADAHMTMQELLRTAYTTQAQVRMQVNPHTNK